jgi:hypothetical protein
LKSILLIVVMSAGGSVALPAAPPASSAPEPAAVATAPAPTAQGLLDDVVAQLPREPLRIEGDIIVRKRRGVVLSQLTFEMSLHWGEAPARARYTIRDAGGSDLEQLTLTRQGSGSPALEYASGNPLARAALPDLAQRIQDTDLSWMDLSLSFLWWRGGRITGTDRVRGRECYVVEVPSPAPRGAYTAARLWVDRELHMLLRAEGCGADGKVIRRLWVDSLKRVDARWIIKDLEVEGPDPVHRTRLTVREVRTETAS